MKVVTRSASIVVAALALTLVGAGQASAASAAPVYVGKAYWTTYQGKLRLHSVPTDYGRRYAINAPWAAWQQALDKAGRKPLSASQNDAIFKQFKCHADVAASKPEWNVEPWRPNVTYSRTVAAGCNPTR